MIDKQRLTAALAALVVVLTAIAGPAAAADSTVFPTGDTNGLVVEVSWDSANVASGDTATLNIEDVTAGTTADTATVTVRNASGTDTYWLPMSEYQIPTSSDATTEVDVVLADSTLGSVGLLRQTEGEMGSQTLEVGSDEGVSANISIIDSIPADSQPIDITVTTYDDGTALGSTTVAVDNSSASYAELNSSELGLSSTTNATVVLTDATGPNGGTDYGAIASYSVSTFSDTGGGGGGSGSGDSTTMMYVLAAAAVGGALLLMRE
ncbi:hypothetical protein [Halopiger djelfimassiliensis]|uniref:hypothetical protein n=1 Tax=Halopiger djelfimassiliensis TaxID=1293047 RepID=UPI000677E65F|nr:hypothetical protein [Halopiger djelfimassiliensis]